MLKYLNIIEQLSDVDKIRLLCDIDLLSDKKYRVMGIPTVRIASIAQFCQEELPSAVALGNSWDPALVEKCAQHRFRSMAEAGIDVAIVPGPKPKINPCRSALSEDSTLCRAMAAAYLKAAAHFGISVLLDDYYFQKDELSWLDEQPDVRMLQEHLIQPYQALIRDAACKGLLTAPDPEDAGWEQSNTYLRHALPRRQDLFFLCPQVSPQHTVTMLRQGCLCFHGSSVALEAAVEHHQNLAARITHGDASAEDLAREMALGKAFSPDMLNEAIDRLLCFLFAAKRKPTVSTLAIDPHLCRNAQIASTVLLKNEHALPIKRASSLCILGDMAFQKRACGNSLVTELTDLFTAQGYTISGTAQGYLLEQERSYSMAQTALDMASEADAVLLFLGFGPDREAKPTKPIKFPFPPISRRCWID